MCGTVEGFSLEYTHRSIYYHIEPTLTEGGSIDEVWPEHIVLEGDVCELYWAIFDRISIIDNWD